MKKIRKILCILIVLGITVIMCQIKVQAAVDISNDKYDPATGTYQMNGYNLPGWGDVFSQAAADFGFSYSGIKILKIRNSYISDDDVIWLRNNLPNLEVLELYDKADITEITNNAFHFNKWEGGHKNITTVLDNRNYGMRLTDIGDYAFNMCPKLTTVKFPSVESLGIGAFSYCTALPSISLPELYKVNDYSFLGCTALIDVKFPNAYYVGTDAFKSCKALQSFDLPEVTEIGLSAFSACISLERIYLPRAQKIYNYAFDNNTALNYISLPQAMTFHDWAFKNCSSLIEMELGETPPSVGKQVFFGCPSNRAIYVPESAIDTYKEVNDGYTNDLYWYGWRIKTHSTGYITDKYDSATGTYEVNENTTGLGILFPQAAKDFGFSYSDIKILKIYGRSLGWEDYFIHGDDVKWLRDNLVNLEVLEVGCNGTFSDELTNNAFHFNQWAGGHKNITTVLDDSCLPISHIGDYAFNMCPKLTTVRFPRVETLGVGVFSYCTALPSISLPELEKVNKYSFLGCTALTSVKFPYAERLEEQSFMGCTAMTNISLAKAKYVGTDAFKSCTALQSFYLPEAIEIGWSAFSTCISLERISLPRVKKIYNYAFDNNAALNYIILPEVTIFHDWAFKNCSSLMGMELGDTPPSVGYEVFSGCPPNRNIYVPKSAINTYKGVDDGNTSDLYWYGWSIVSTAPTATTTNVSSISSTGATLKGMVNANNLSTIVKFEYGTDINYGTTEAADQSPVTGNTNTAVSKVMTGLTPNTTYHYRVVSQNAGGTTYGTDQIFTTADVVYITIQSINVTTNGGNDGSITVTAAEGNGLYEYRLDGGTWQPSNQFTGLTAGSYQVQARDSGNINNESTASTVIITEPVVPTQVTISTTEVNVSTHGGNDGGITVTAAEGNGLYEYRLDGGTWQPSNQFTGLTAGSYQVQARDSGNINNESTASTVTITEPAVPTQVTISTTEVNVSTHGGNDGGITITASEGSGLYEYRLDNGVWQTSNQFTGLAAGNYEVQARDSGDISNISTVSTVTITEPSAPPIQVTINTTEVNVSKHRGNDGSITVTASEGSGLYEYSKDNGSTWQDSNVFNGLTAGSYQVQVRDRGDISNISTVSTVTITEPSAPPIQVTINTTKTNVSTYGGKDGSITVKALEGSGSYEYKLDSGTWQTSNQFTGLTAGSYKVQARDSGDISNISIVSTVTITEPSAPPTQVTINTTEVDVTTNGGNDGSITLTASEGSGSYEYRLDSGTWQTSNQFTGLTAGSYKVQARDRGDISNISTVSTVTITEPSAPPTQVKISIVKTDVTSNVTTNGRITVTATEGSSSYEYSKDNGVTWQDSNVFNGLSAGNYEILARDKVDTSNISTVSTVTITEPSAPTQVTISIVKTDVTSTTSGSITVIATGGNGSYEYRIDSGTWQTSNQFTGLSAGTYEVQAKDDSGNVSNVSTVTITEPLAPTQVTISIVKTDVTSTTNGSITVTATGGSGSYEYSKDNGVTWQNSNVFNGLSEGVYEVLARDKPDTSNESTVSTITISKPNEPSQPSKPSKPSKPSGGTSSSSTPAKHPVDKAFEKGEENEEGQQVGVIKIKKPNNKGEYKQDIPANFFKEQNKVLKIETPLVTVTLPDNMFTKKPKGKIELSIKINGKIGDNLVIDINITENGIKREWSNDSVEVEIAIPYTPTEEERENPHKIIGVYIADNGEEIPIILSYYDPDKGAVILKTNHFSYYGVQYVNKKFEDIGSYTWAKEAIEALAARGVINGITEKEFTPQADITRADFVVLITRFLGLKGEATENFSDVKVGTYYYHAVGIAKEMGIVSGTGDNKFKPLEPITRQDMMVIIKRALEITGQDSKLTANSGSEISDFNDNKEVASYAKDSVEYLISKGIVNGDGKNINPRSYTKRVEVATLIYRILSILTK